MVSGRGVNSDVSTAARAEPLVSLRPGWPAALVGLLLAALTANTIVRSPTGSLVESWVAPQLAGRLAIAGLAVFTVAIIFGSERLAGVAGVPMLTAALLGVDPDLGLSWSRALIIGCLWYGALEAGWASIEFRRDARYSRAVTQRRVQEVATVVTLTVIVGGGGAALATLAPTRTLLVRALLIAAVVGAMAAALQHLRATQPDQ